MVYRIWLWQLGRACTKHFGRPICTRKTTGCKRFEFTSEVVFDSSNRGRALVDNQIGCAWITIVGKTNTSSVDQEFWVISNAANGRAMCMPEDNNRVAEGTIDGFQLSVGRFWCRRSPATLGSGMDPREA